MSLEISQETQARLLGEAQKEGVSIDTLLQRLMDEHEEVVRAGPPPQLPVWHLGAVGPLRRRDIYDDAQ
jgi:hypothetical protein